jgi:DNA repair protein Rad18
MLPRLKQSFLDLTPSPRRLHSDRANKAIDAIKEQLSSHDHARTLIASRSPLTPPSSQTPPTLADSAMDPSYNLPDSTDWIATSIPSFEPLEAALRCEVCKEFYENPVITNCSHTFCSLCIRRCITSDGKCPTCKAANQADKLLPNFAVREIVNRFQEARSQALELARRDKSDSDAIGTTKKRKLEDTDIEEEEPVRQTRSRMTRTRSERTNGVADAPIQVPDSEDDGDADFVPDGMVRCPICSKPMKEELVWTHINSCNGEAPGGGRSTRSRQVPMTKHPDTFTDRMVKDEREAPSNDSPPEAAASRGPRSESIARLDVRTT